MFRLFAEKLTLQKVGFFGIGVISGVVGGKLHRDTRADLAKFKEETRSNFNEMKKEHRDDVRALQANILKLADSIANGKIDPELQDMYCGEGEKAQYFLRDYPKKTF